MFEKDCPIPESFRSMFGNILFLALLFFLTFISRFIFAPLMPAIENELGINHSQAGTLFLMISLGFFTGQIGSGLLSSRVNHKGSLIVSTFGVGMSLLFLNLTSTFWIIRIILFLLGASAGLHMPSAIATITAMVNRQEWGKALAVHQIAPPLSLVSGPLLVILLLDLISWRTLLALLGGTWVVVGLLFLRFGRCGDFPGDLPRLTVLKTLITQRSFWIMVVLFALATGGNVGIYSMLPLFLVNERSFDGDWANTLLGLSRISGLFMPFVAGWLIGRFGEKMCIFIVMVVAGVATILLGALSGKWLLLSIFLQPAVIGCYFTAGFATLARIVQPNLRSFTAAYTTSISFLIGGGLLPTAMGYMGQAYSFGIGIILTGFLMILSSWLVFFLRLIEKMEDGC